MSAKGVVEVSPVSYWKNDSLYVYIYDMDGFYQSYSKEANGLCADAGMA